MHWKEADRYEGDYEAPLADILSDPVALAVMQRDGLDPGTVSELCRDVGERLHGRADEAEAA